MLNFAANLSWLFTERPFISRFAAAKECGFRGIEALFPYDFPCQMLQQQLIQHELSWVLINAPAGAWDQGERGLAAQPGRESDHQASLKKAREYALTLGCKQIHVMAGNIHPELSYQQQQDLFIERMRWACDFFADTDIQLLIEPLNQQDMPGYFLAGFGQAAEVINAVSAPNIKLQFDFYHCQKISGNIVRTMEAYWELIGHIQIASVPERNEPDRGELDYIWLFNYLEKSHYQGWVGCEYSPEKNSELGLIWMHNYLNQ